MIGGDSSRGADVAGTRYDAKGIRSRSPIVELTSTGEPISSSEDFEELRDREADRLETILSFRPLKSANVGVEGMRGEADALRACRTTSGDKNAFDSENVADRGAQGDGSGIQIGSESVVAGRYDCRKLKGAGGTGLRYRSLGLRVKLSEGSELLRLCPSLGSSSTLRRWPGKRGQNVVDGCEGLWHSSSSSTLYCKNYVSNMIVSHGKLTYIVPVCSAHLQRPVPL